TRWQAEVAQERTRQRTPTVGPRATGLLRAHHGSSVRVGAPGRGETPALRLKHGGALRAYRRSPAERGQPGLLRAAASVLPRHMLPARSAGFIRVRYIPRMGRGSLLAAISRTKKAPLGRRRMP